MKSEWKGLAHLAEVLVNGSKAADKARSAEETKPTISMADLVNRKVSTVRCRGKVYTVTVEEVTIT